MHLPIVEETQNADEFACQVLHSIPLFHLPRRHCGRTDRTDRMGEDDFEQQLTHVTKLTIVRKATRLIYQHEVRTPPQISHGLGNAARGATRQKKCIEQNRKEAFLDARDILSWVAALPEPHSRRVRQHRKGGEVGPQGPQKE